MSLRDDILNFSEDPYLALRPEVIPEWGGLTVYYRGWTGKERDEAEKMFGDVSKLERSNLRARFLVRYLFDETGARIFTDADADKLGEKNSVVLDRLFKTVYSLNKITADDAESDVKN